MLDSLTVQFETIQWSGSRPSQAPAGWVLFNAYRPLCGTLKPTGGGNRWVGARGPRGQHWAAVDPADSLARQWLECNLRDGAVIVECSD